MLALTSKRLKIRNSRQQPTRGPYSKADSTIGLRLPAYAGKPMSVSRFSDCESPSRIECSPPASTFKFKLIAMRALPGQRTCGGSAP